MASQLRFEGNDLEILLERVRVEVGHDARIVAANKLRKGGVGGFFSKEMFEVIVEPIASEHAETLRPAARFGRARKHSKYVVLKGRTVVSAVKRSART